MLILALWYNCFKLFYWFWDSRAIFFFQFKQIPEEEKKRVFIWCKGAQCQDQDKLHRAGQTPAFLGDLEFTVLSISVINKTFRNLSPYIKLKKDNTWLLFNKWIGKF